MLGKKPPQTVRRVQPQSGKSDKSKVLSYYSNRDPRSDQIRRDVPPDTLRAKPKSLFWNHVFTAVIGTVLILLAIDLFWLDKQPQVSFVKGSSTEILLQPKSVYTAATEKLIASSLLNQNKLTINVASVSAELVKEFPEINSATIALPFSGHKMDVYIQPSDPAVLLGNGVHVYVLNSSGIAIGIEGLANSQSISSLGLPQMNYSNLPIKIGSQALTSNDVSFAQYVFQELAAQHINVSSMNIPPGSRELDVTISGQSYYTKYNLESAVKEQVGSYLAVQGYLSANKATPSQYIDVRVPGRAYYK
jgi:hypothetical protein